MRYLDPAECLIVAGDYDVPVFEQDNDYDMARRLGPVAYVRSKVLNLADALEGTGVCLKMASALRACGYEIINEVHQRRLRVFADLKLWDTHKTLSIDGKLIREYDPEFLTVSCSSGVPAIRALKRAIPRAEILGVSVLSNLKEDEVRAMFVCSTEEAMKRLSKLAVRSNLSGLISHGQMIKTLRAEFGIAISINAVAIRPEGTTIIDDDQDPDKIVTPTEAIEAGADRMVIGRPITEAKDQFGAVMEVLAEIESALEIRYRNHT
jgi:orotidine-5'-phosphate decarboxylase